MKMMNNADMPASPQTWVPDYGNEPPVRAEGLTKREHFAAMAMQGFCAQACGTNTEKVAKLSAAMADDLLKALEET
ncbi:hypothetical protein N9878_01690 [bacterium]|nr:hypothetical protein [bacterium]